VELKEVAAPPKAQKYHTLGSRSRNKARQNRSAQAPVVRLSTFGATAAIQRQVFHSLKVESGQKEVTLTLDNPDSGSGEPTVYTYRDEHSAPFSWMSRSQQELRFESGTPEQLTEEELAERGLELVGGGPPRAPSATSSNQSGNQHSQSFIRLSRGNPSYAKPVGIPQVPSVMSPTEQGLPARESRKVSPHRINNFVCETDNNRLVFDFGNPVETSPGPAAAASAAAASAAASAAVEESGSSSGSSTGSGSSSAKFSSTGGLLARMKEKTKSSIKRSLSTVSKHKLNGNAGSVATRDESNCSPTPTQSTMSTYSSVGSLGREGSLQRPLVPPPPPPTITKPSCAPPPPPPQRENKCDKVKRSDTLTPLTCSTTTTAKDHDQNTNDNCEVQIVSQCLQPKVRPVDEVTTNFEDFKIDLKVESDIPKTGFDFLDDW